jgi:excisionase family DNA binding protein
MNTWSTGAEGAEHSGRENTVVGRNLRERSDADLHELLTVGEVAALLKVSRSWVYEHTRSRGTARAERLPYIKIGKYKRFDPLAVREFIRRRAKSA